MQQHFHVGRFVIRCVFIRCVCAECRRITSSVVVLCGSAGSTPLTTDLILQLSAIGALKTPVWPSAYTLLISFGWYSETEMVITAHLSVGRLTGSSHILLSCDFDKNVQSSVINLNCWRRDKEKPGLKNNNCNRSVRVRMCCCYRHRNGWSCTF